MHLMINVGMTIGLMPVIGIPLPFISYGGSSMLSFTVMLFIFVSLVRRDRKYFEGRVSHLEFRCFEGEITDGGAAYCGNLYIGLLIEEVAAEVYGICAVAGEVRIYVAAEPDVQGALEGYTEACPRKKR